MKTLLYFGPSGIGDWCFIWPSIPTLLKQEQCDQLHLIIPYNNPGNQLLLNHPLVAKITYLERETSVLGIIKYSLRWLKLLSHIHKQHYPVVAISYLSNQPDNLLFCFLSRIPKRIGRDYPRSPLTSLAFNKLIHSDSAQGRVSIHMDYVSAHIGSTHEPANLFSEMPLLGIPSETKSKIKKPYIVLACGGGREATWRFWPPDHYRKLIQKNPTLNFILLGSGNDDARQASTIQSPTLLSNVIDLTNQTSMNTALEIIQGATIVIGNDTGIPNIAATLDIPTLTVYGPTDPKITGAALLGATAAHKKVPCGPCFTDQQNPSMALQCLHQKCLSTLSPEQVSKTLITLLKNG